LRADGVLGRQEDAPGQRSYLYVPAGSGEPLNANPHDLPDRLIWETPPFDRPAEFAGNIELELTASITALDTGWIAVLYDVPPEGEPEAITAGWLRASLSSIDPKLSRPGAPVVECRHPTAVRPGEQAVYRIPMVPNARHLAQGHLLRLVIASADEADRSPTVLGFTHTVVREASLNTVLNGSRLWLPWLPTLGEIAE
jgi:predicted acyl esterase